jgi:NitT/TauT family transport system substrate-binding protein
VGSTLGVAGALPFYAQELGFFKNAGLNVTLSAFPRAAITMDAIQTNAIDFAQFSLIALASAIAHGIPVAMIGTGSIYADDVPPVIALCVAKDSPIRNASDFEGSTIGVASLLDVSILGVYAWLDKNGADRSKIKMIELSFAEMAPSVQRGTIQAAVLAEPFLTSSFDRLREVPKVYSAVGKRWAGEAWYARSEYAVKNAALVKRFMDALYATQKYVDRNPQKIEPLLSTNSKIPLETVHAMRKVVFSEGYRPELVQPVLDVAFRYNQLPRHMMAHELMAR